MVNIFISFADEDKKLVREIEKVTKPWVRQGLVKIWHKGQLLGGGVKNNCPFLKWRMRISFWFVSAATIYFQMAYMKK